MPHVASFFRGIHLTVNAIVDQEINSNQLRNIYEKFYENEALVKIIDDPQVANNAGQHYACIGNFTTGNSDGKNHVVVTDFPVFLGHAPRGQNKCHIPIFLRVLSLVFQSGRSRGNTSISFCAKSKKRIGNNCLRGKKVF